MSEDASVFGLFVMLQIYGFLFVQPKEMSFSLQNATKFMKELVIFYIRICLGVLRTLGFYINFH